jgi:hypothetical protein
MKCWNSMVAGMALALACAPLQLSAQEGVGDVVYVPTPQIVVDEMLRMAKVGPQDFVIDLGSGDGRIVITAAKKYGARGFGVDLDPQLLKMSNEAAQREGVADRAKFVEQNLFETDLSQATVITSYLLPEMNEKLRPKILSLKPGTRVVAHDYHMGEWHADEMHTLDVPEKKVGNPGKSYVYSWIVPAKIAGRWNAQVKGGSPASWDFEFEQRFQMFDGTASAAGQKVAVRQSKLEGDQINFVVAGKSGDRAARHNFRGTVKGDTMDGILVVGEGAAQKRLPWSAKLVQRADPKTSQSSAARAQ